MAEVSAGMADGTESVASVSTFGQELMGATACKPQDGRLRREWTVQGAGVVMVQVRNPSNSRHKDLLHALQLLDKTPTSVEANVATAAELAVAMARAINE